MLGFFSKIRHRLMKENRLSKYLLYAIGEILLIVIGILIALQIDNWNEGRKLQAKEYELLTDLKSDLLANKIQLEEGIEFNLFSAEAYIALYNVLVNDSAYNELAQQGVQYISNWRSPFFSQSSYESFKNIGLDVIPNDSLKEEIVNLHDDTFAYLTGDLDRAEWSFDASVKQALVVRHVRYEGFAIDKGAVIVDMQAAKNDDTFINMLSQMIRSRQAGVDIYKTSLLELENVIDLIDQELERIKP